MRHGNAGRVQGFSVRIEREKIGRSQIREAAQAGLRQASGARQLFCPNEQEIAFVRGRFYYLGFEKTAPKSLHGDCELRVILIVRSDA